MKLSDPRVGVTSRLGPPAPPPSSPWGAPARLDALTHVHRMANGPVADEILYWRDEARLESGEVAPMSRGPRRVM